MEAQRLLIVLTVANLALLAFLLVKARGVETAYIVPVLRGRALEIVDDQGKVRGAIKVFPAGPARRAGGSLSTASGRIHPETVLLRLIDANGRPSVKVGTSEEGGGLGLGGGGASASFVRCLRMDLDAAHGVGDNRPSHGHHSDHPPT